VFEGALGTEYYCACLTCPLFHATKHAIPPSSRAPISWQDIDHAYEHLRGSAENFDILDVTSRGEETWKLAVASYQTKIHGVEAEVCDLFVGCDLQVLVQDCSISSQHVFHAQSLSFLNSSKNAFATC
jgi:hypothetical protein